MPPEVTLIVSAGTDWKDKEFTKLARQWLDAALAKPFDAIREAAVADHRRFMERCQLTLPEGPNSKRPTPNRVKAAEKDPDPALAALPGTPAKFVASAPAAAQPWRSSGKTAW